MSAPVTTRPSWRSQPGAGVALLLIVGSGILTQLLTTVTGVISARMLGVEGRGQVVLVTSLALMTSQLTFGGSLPNAITRQLADRGVTARDGLRHIAPRLMRWALVPAIIAGGYLLFVERHTGANTRYALAIAVVITALQTMMSRILVGAMLGEGADLLHVAMTGLLPQGLTTVVIGSAFAAGVRWNAVDLLVVTMICVGGVLLARLGVLAKPTHAESDELDDDELYSLARRTHIGSVGPIDGLSLDRTLVGSLLGSAPLGLYSAAFALAGLTSILGGCLAMVILPRVTVAQRDPVAEKELVRRWLLLSVALIAVVVAVLELIAGWVIRVAFGSAFTGATSCAHWLIAAGGLLDLRRVFIAILQGRERGGQASLIELALTPFVIIGIVLSSAQDSLAGVGMTMTAVAAAACFMLGIAVTRSGPLVRKPPRPPGRHRAPTGAARRRTQHSFPEGIADPVDAGFVS